MTFFPRSTVELRLEEPAAFRRFSHSVVETALVTGAIVRLYRALVLANDAGGWGYWVTTGVVGVAFVCAMVTAHLANYPVRRWLWRAPAFAGLAVVGEMLTSLLLIWAGREPAGSARATFADWPGMAANALLYRGLGIGLWAAVLAAAVEIVRHVRPRRRRS